MAEGVHLGALRARFAARHLLAVEGMPGARQRRGGIELVLEGRTERRHRHGVGALVGQLIGSGAVRPEVVGAAQPGAGALGVGHTELVALGPWRLGHQRLGLRHHGDLPRLGGEDRSAGGDQGPHGQGLQARVENSGGEFRISMHVILLIASRTILVLVRHLAVACFPDHCIIRSGIPNAGTRIRRPGQLCFSDGSQVAVPGKAMIAARTASSMRMNGNAAA